jgi:hypothetical protein
LIAIDKAAVLLNQDTRATGNVRSVKQRLPSFPFSLTPQEWIAFCAAAATLNESDLFEGNIFEDNILESKIRRIGGFWF